MYQQNIMWLDGVILLPIVILGIEKIIKESSSRCYILSLAAAIIFNYYIGFMLCIFSVLYFGYYFFFIANGKCIKAVANFGISSVLAGGLSAFVVLPTLYSLQNNRAELDITGFGIDWTGSHRSFSAIFSKLFWGSYDGTQQWDGRPGIYCSLIVVVFLVLFFLSKEIRIKEKIGAGIFFFIILMSFQINGLNHIWHGFNVTSGFPYRYSFVFCFLMIIIAYKGFLVAKEKLSVLRLVLTFLSILILALYIERVLYSYSQLYKLAINLILVCLILVVSFLYARKKSNILAIILAMICVFDLGTYAYMVLSEMHFERYSNFSKFVRSNQPIIDEINETDTSFFRLEKTYFFNHNDAMMLNYRGLTHYSSSEKYFIKDFIGTMGLQNNRDAAMYNRGSTISVDSLLGVKYLLSDYKMLKPYELLKQREDILVYQNPYALPVGFMVSEDVLAVTTGEDNPFTRQSSIWKAMTGIADSELFTPVDINRIATINLTSEDYAGGVRYQKENQDEAAFIDLYVDANSIDPLYAYFPTNQRREVEVFINDKLWGDYFFAVDKNNVIEMGNFAADEQILLRLKLDSDDLFIYKPYFYHENMEVFFEFYNDLSASPYEISRFTESYFKGEITNPGDKHYALFTIPYEEDWKIQVNGNPTSAVMVFDALMAVEIPEGTHTITLRYVPGGMYLGIAITVFSLIILIITANKLSIFHFCGKLFSRKGV
jgi:uncharacterized membrane protein YfhO